MDLAYDHILEENYTGSDRASTPTPPKDDAAFASTTTSDPADPSTPRPAAPQPQRQNLQTEVQETIKAFSNTAWGAKLGGIWGSVSKQGQSYYEEAVKEVDDLRIDAVKGLNDIKESLVNRARSLSQGEEGEVLPGAIGAEDGSDSKAATSVSAEENAKQLQDNETFIARFKAEAAKRLKEVQKAEDAADEALLRFGTNLKKFLSEAVTITEPDDTTGSTEVLFESKDHSGKRRIHTSRFDAQLHVIHTTPTGFSADPSGSGEQWVEFKKDFDIEKKTDAIAADLEKYPELRQTMESLVPEKVEYKDFWSRYYFLRHILETQEEKRKELLKASTNATEEVAWDEDSDDEKTPSTPQITETQAKKPLAQHTNDSSTTINVAGLKPIEGRRSHDEKSVADSEASYDIVSGAPSRAASSPKEKKVDESDEEDWE